MAPNCKVNAFSATVQENTGKDLPFAFESRISEEVQASSLVFALPVEQDPPPSYTTIHAMLQAGEDSGMLLQPVFEYTESKLNQN
ncbi:MAG: hypothetical protein NC344_08725 [Bacteroidales bacterium]|nr:hypothetical protein [Bacteroidales bacterium]MCM1206736.1 hypothetical protein [Bacillota bacterium]MCM1510931.1 hypothetical protein [Clostridium sp.]